MSDKTDQRNQTKQDQRQQAVDKRAQALRDNLRRRKVEAQKAQKSGNKDK